MNKKSWQILLGASLISLSALLYLLHYVIFRDAHHIFIYLLGDIAFVPIEVLLVAMIIQQILEMREKSERMEKLNMVIGAFFSEVGTRLLSHFARLDRRIDAIREILAFKEECTDETFESANEYLKSHSYEVSVRSEDLELLKKFLESKRDFLLRLIENPNLLEHESFSNLLMAVFHFTEELESRKDFNGLPARDFEHMSGDIKRAYSLLVGEWLSYMKHLRSNYPFLFSLAMRTNPFDAEASVIIK